MSSSHKASQGAHDLRGRAREWTGRSRALFWWSLPNSYLGTSSKKVATTQKIVLKLGIQNVIFFVHSRIEWDRSKIYKIYKVYIQSTRYYFGVLASWQKNSSYIDGTGSCLHPLWGLAEEAWVAEFEGIDDHWNSEGEFSDEGESEEDEGFDFFVRTRMGFGWNWHMVHWQRSSREQTDQQWRSRKVLFLLKKFVYLILLRIEK